VHVFCLVWHAQTIPAQSNYRRSTLHSKRDQWWVVGLPEMTEIFFAENNAELLQLAFIFGE